MRCSAGGPTAPTQPSTSPDLTSRCGALSGVVVHVAIQEKTASNLDARLAPIRNFELISARTSTSGRVAVEFGTVRPRVSIPAPNHLIFPRHGPLDAKVCAQDDVDPGCN